MIKFTLVCEDAHDFETWFANGAAYDTQVKRGLVTCPVCNSTRVTKAIMTPALVTRGRKAPADPAAPAAEGAPVVEPPPQPVALLDERQQMLRAMMQHVRAKIIENSDDVGKRFPQEARRMHEGEIPTRSIRGEASADDARALVEDGIEILPLPPAPEEWN